MIWLAVVFTVTLIIGVPIAFSLGMAGLVSLIAGGFNPVTAPQKMFTSIDSFVLLAAPFYILAGEIMNRGGLTDRLIRLSMLVVGRVRGGTAYACIVAAIFLSGISGTAVGDAAALGQIFIRNMPKEGYKKEFAAALTVSAAMVGPIIPPSVIMVIYASVAQVSVIKLFLAGFVPGLLQGVACGVIVYIYGLRGHLPKPSFELKPGELFPLARDGALVFSLPAMIVIGTMTGAFTATEAGGIAVVYAILLGFIAFRNLTVKGLWDSLMITGRMTASLFLVVSLAAIASYVMILGGVSQWTAEVLQVFEGQPILFMLVVAGALLVLGSFLDPGPQVLLFVPVLMPMARAMGIDDLQFSMVILLVGTLGLITPPVGVVLFVACRIGDIPVGRLFRAVVPFLIAQTGVIILLILFPVLSNGLPNLLYTR
jgi:tripartite ATP-independent transporter DctM subunit